MESKIGNAFETSLHNLFMDSRLDEYSLWNKFEKCSKCELRGYCRGYSAVTFGYTEICTLPTHSVGKNTIK